jgi:hypothetical protein
MKVGRPFKPTGRRLENLSNLIKSKYPQDKWVLEPILPVFLSIIDSNSTIEQQEQVIDSLNRVFNDYEFRYGVILENMNPKDTITVDVPLFIRLLEYAREDAKTDMDLHNVAERAISLSTEGECLGMESYDSIVGQSEQLDEMRKIFQVRAGIIK